MLYTWLRFLCFIRLADGLCFRVDVVGLGGSVVLVVLNVVEQRYRAVLEVLNEGVSVAEVAARAGVTRQTVHRGCAGMGLMGGRGWSTGRRCRCRVRIRWPRRTEWFEALFQDMAENDYAMSNDRRHRSVKPRLRTQPASAEAPRPGRGCRGTPLEP